MGKVQEFIMARVWVKSVEGSTVTLQDGCFFVGTEETSRTFKNVREAAIGSAKKRVLNTLAPVKEPKAPKAVKAPKSPKEPKAQKRKLIVPEENFDIPTMDSVEYTYDEEVESIIADIIGN